MNRSILTTKCYICRKVLEFGNGEVERHTYYNHPSAFHTIFSKLKKVSIMIENE